MQPNYPFKEIEEKVQSYWDNENTFSVAEDSKKTKILLLVHVSLSKWKASYGTC